MIDLDDVKSVIGRNVVSSSGEKIGKAGQVYLDDTSGQPEWVTVSTGLFGTKETFVPLAEASTSGNDLVVPYDKDQVKKAPNVGDGDEHLSEQEERRLYEHYGFRWEDSYGGSADGDNRRV